jgi:AcrR family transcriptional regulator
MSSYHQHFDWNIIQIHILQLEGLGKVTRTFRRLDPARQQAVVHAILDEAGEKGPATINIKEVARRADVSVGSLYQYFGNRDGLLDFAVALCVRYMVYKFEQFTPMLAALPLSDALRDYIMGGIEWNQTETGLVRFFGRAAYQGDPKLAETVVRPIADVMRKSVTEMLTQAANRGEIRDNIDFEATARAINSIMIAIGDAQLYPELNIYYQVSDETTPLERVMDALIEMLFNGIAE